MCSSFMRANLQYSVTQNLKILEAGRHLWRSRSLAPLVLDCQDQVAQGCLQLGPENLQGQKLQNFSGNLFQHFTTPRVKMHFLCLTGISSISVCTHCLSFFFEYHWNITSIRIKKFWWEETFLGWFGSYIIAQISAPEKWMEDGWKTCWNCWSNFRWL